MKKETSLLQNLGLDQHEAFIYEKLLEKETNSITDIEKLTKLHRPQIYAAIDKLLEKSLVHVVVKGKRKFYTATSPQLVEQIFARKEKEFFDYVESLHKKYEKSHSHKPEVTFSEGKEAIQKTYMDIPNEVKKDEMYYRYMPVSKLYRSKYIPKNYRESRDKKGLERMIITNKHTMHERSNHLTRTVKAVPAHFDLFEYEMSLTMFNDKVVLVDFETESVIEIKHERFAEFQKKVFKLLFSKL